MNATTTTIRPAVLADSPDARRLIAGMGGHGEVADLARFDDVYAEMLALPFCRAFVAERDGAVVGYAEIHRRPATAHGCREAWLAALAVDAQARRSGAGRLLLDTLDKAAADLGCDEIVAESSSARSAANPFFAALGFETQPTAHRHRRRVEHASASDRG